MEDIAVAEEDTLELLITYQLRIDQNRRNYKQAQEKEEYFRTRMNGRDAELDLENENDRFMYEMIMSNNKYLQELDKNLKDLADKHNALLESLNVTRRQREERQKIGGDTFLSLIKAFNDRDRREEIGKYNERMRASTVSQKEKLRKAHTFVDGTIEPILLDGSDFINKDTENA